MTDPQRAEIGEIWPFDLANYRAAPAAEGVTGWVCMRQDGTREILYAYEHPDAVERYYLGGDEDYGIAILPHYPLPVAVSVPSAELHTIHYAAPTRDGGWYMDADWTTIHDEPVNQAPKFYEWRDHLMALAHDYTANHQFERGSTTAAQIRRLPTRPSALSDEDLVRNANISQYYPEMVGHLWRLLFDWADPANANWRGVENDLLQRMIGDFCGVFTGPDCLGRVHDDHDHVVWADALIAGKRIIPRVDSEPYGVISLQGEDSVTEFVATADRRNFRKAIRLYRRATPQDSRGSHPWPDSVTDEWHVRRPRPATPPALPAGEFRFERQAAVRFWAQQYLEARLHPEATDLALRPYRRFIEMQLLAVSRAVNYESDVRFVADTLMAARRITADFYFSHPAERQQIIAKWSDAASTAWEFGYLYFDSGGTLEEDRDPSTLFSAGFNISQHETDPRRWGFIVIVENIDTSDDTLTRSLQPWTDQAEWVARLAAILADTPETAP